MEGNIQDYRARLIKKIGEQKVLMLEAAKHTQNRLSNFELELIAKHYKKETKKFTYQIK
jgi:16S rRNA C1402 (ribose-2'-O) methylase RsmI